MATSNGTTPTTPSSVNSSSLAASPSTPVYQQHQITDVKVERIINAREEAAKVRADGPGLRAGLIGRPCYFSVDYSAAIGGKLAVSLVSPRQIVQRRAILSRAPESTGYHYMFTPVSGGEHVLKVLYAGVHIPGSPFRVQVARTETYIEKSPMWTHGEPNPAKVIVTGAGVREGVVGRPATFRVDTTDAGDGTLTIEVECEKRDKSRKKLDASSELNPADGSHFVSYTTPDVGLYHVVVKYAGGHVPGSPFTAEIRAKGE
ncbi:filamin-B-like [Oscarella lobularis]|uniref:filamin-B-like n=1 Tax=Oscarella lobularis TaxID=121494 RepID=UPI0033134033